MQSKIIALFESMDSPRAKRIYYCILAFAAGYFLHAILRAV